LESVFQVWLPSISFSYLPDTQHPAQTGNAAIPHAINSRLKDDEQKPDDRRGLGDTSGMKISE
jgi:hypothetical protein